MIVSSEDIRWGTTLRLLARDSGSRQDLQQLLTTHADRLERLVSRFRSDSEISAVNRQPGQWVEVSWDFVTVLTAALLVAAETDGLVDPTLGQHVDAAGYRNWRGDGSPTPPQPSITGQWSGVEIRPGRTQARVRIPPAAQLDLGAIAKAWLADRLAESLWQRGVAALADLGGDIRAIGTDPEWILGAADGTVPFTVSNAGLATSGTDRRTWQDQTGQLRHHIIDPRTGTSAVTPWRRVSVLAATAVAANAVSTAAIILGDEAPRWIADRGIDALLVSDHHCLPVGRWPSTEVA